MASKLIPSGQLDPRNLTSCVDLEVFYGQWLDLLKNAIRKNIKKMKGKTEGILYDVHRQSLFLSKIS